LKSICLKREGNTPELSDKFIILVIGTVSARRQDFRRNIGIGFGLNTVQGWLQIVARGTIIRYSEMMYTYSILIMCKMFKMLLLYIW